MRTIALLPIALFLSAAAMAQPAPGEADNRYTAKSWQDAVDTLPCTAFVAHENGTWTFPGAVQFPDNSVVSNMTFGPNDESRKLDVRCKPAR